MSVAKESSIRNILTIDVEDYFHVSAFESVSPPETWHSRQLRVERNTDSLIRILAEHNDVKATFFVLGWVADRCPDLVKRIALAGHEVASHGYWHRRAYNQGREEFREDVRRSKAILADLTGSEVFGYRAPSYSISQSCLWAFDELFEAGFVYDSSVFPIRHDLYGISFWPRFPFLIERLQGEGAGNWVPSEFRGAHVLEPDPPTGLAARQFLNRPTLLEIPITTLRLCGRTWPIAGGGYFRLLPYAVSRWGLRRINRAERRSFVFYLHPWELDPGQPRMAGAGLKSRFRHYLNLQQTERRFGELLRDFTFGSIREVVGLGSRSGPTAAPIAITSPGQDSGRG